MHKTTPRFVSCLCLAGAVCVCAAVATAEPTLVSYEFEPVLSNTTPMPGSGRTLAVTSAPTLAGGAVYFTGHDETFSYFGLFVADADGLRVLADTFTQAPDSLGAFIYFSTVHPPSVTRDAVYFDALEAGCGVGAYRYDFATGHVERIACGGQIEIPEGGGLTFSEINFPVGRDQNVAIRGHTPGVLTGLYAVEEEGLRRLVDSVTPVPGLDGQTLNWIPFGAELSGDDAAFRAGVISGGVVTWAGLYVGSPDGAGGTDIVAVADYATPAPGGVGAFSGFDFGLGRMGFEDGTLVFAGADSQGTTGLYLHDASGLRLVVDESVTPPGASGPFQALTAGNLLGVNIHQGRVTFVGAAEGPMGGIYQFDSGELTKVVDRWDGLGGREWRYFRLGTQGVEDRNIAFLAQKSSGPWTLYRAQPRCAADLSRDGELSGVDVGLFLDAYFEGSSVADLNDSGTLNGADVGLFLHAYGTGCGLD